MLINVAHWYSDWKKFIKQWQKKIRDYQRDFGKKGVQKSAHLKGKT
jgi:hypothetical protein